MLPYSIDNWAIYAKSVKPTPKPAKGKFPATKNIIKKLKVSEATRELINEQIGTIGVKYHHFKGIQMDQDNALQLIGELNLHIPNVVNHDRDVRSKITIQDTDSNTIQPIDTKLDIIFNRHRRIYQCQSGADHEQGHKASKTHQRRRPWENIGCGFWARMTTTHLVTGEGEQKDDVLITIDEIFGDLVHSGACNEQTTMFRDPTIPIHPDLRAYTLQLLREKMPLNVVKEKARVFALSRWGNSPGDEHYRFRLRNHDSSSLYRSLNRESGIPFHSQAQDNLDRWFGTEDSPPDASLTTSCLHYSPEIQEIDQRFVVILSTPVQQQMAWKFGHNRQVLMDLTFGFCSARTLLVILMVIDDEHKGIPIAQIIFTAKKDVKAVHADYNKVLLDDVLRRFKEGMGKNKAGETFNFAVGATDNDVRERYALDNNFSGILLILCMFHILQSWRNHLNISLSKIPKGDDRNTLRSRLWRLLMKLIRDISDYSQATVLFNAEIAYFKTLGKSGSTPMEKKQSKAALHFLNYLHSYMKVEDYWRSWSPAGAIEAARRLGVDVAIIARTTNHLESFNGRIKNKFFQMYEHCGRLPRIDVWILVLITRVLPDFFDCWVERRHQLAYYGLMRQAPSASNALPSVATSLPGSAPQAVKFTAVKQVWDAADAFMERAFKGFVIRNNIFTKTFSEEHKMAVFEFEQSLVEIGNVDDDSGTDFQEDAGIMFLGGEIPSHESDCVIELVSQQCEPPITPMDAISSIPVVPSTSECMNTIENSPENQSFSSQQCNPSTSRTESTDMLPELDLEMRQLDNKPDRSDMTAYSDSDEFALDSSAILTDLDLPGIGACHSNSKVSAIMELQRAEDVWLQAVKYALRSGLTQDDVKTMLSPSIIRRLALLSLWDDDENACEISCEPSNPGSSSPHTPASSKPSPHTSISPVLAFLKLDDKVNDPAKLGMFEKQKKSRRHVSHGIR